MKYALEIKPLVFKQIESYKKSGNKILLKKISILLEELVEHPKTGTGKPEQLKGSLLGYWSRRISREHRLIYFINERIITVDVLSAHGHYSEK